MSACLWSLILIPLIFESLVIKFDWFQQLRNAFSVSSRRRSRSVRLEAALESRMLLSSSGGVQFAVDDIGNADISVFEEAPVDDQPLDIGTEDLGTEQVEFIFEDVQTGDEVWLVHTDDSLDEEYFPNDESVEEYVPVDENGEPLPGGAWFRGGVGLERPLPVEGEIVSAEVTWTEKDDGQTSDVQWDVEPEFMDLSDGEGEWFYGGGLEIYSETTNETVSEWTEAAEPEVLEEGFQGEPVFVACFTGEEFLNPDPACEFPLPRLDLPETVDGSGNVVYDIPIEQSVDGEWNPDVMFYSMAGGELPEEGSFGVPELLEFHPIDFVVEESATEGEWLVDERLLRGAESDDGETTDNPTEWESSGPVDELVEGEENPEVIFYSMADGELPLTANAPGDDGGDVATEAPVEEPIYGPMVPVAVPLDPPVDQPVDSGLDPDVIFQSAVGGGRGTDENGIIQPNFRGNETANEDRLATALLSKTERAAQRAQQQQARQLATQTRRAARAARRASRLASR